MTHEAQVELGTIQNITKNILLIKRSLPSKHSTTQIERFWLLHPYHLENTKSKFLKMKSFKSELQTKELSNTFFDSDLNLFYSSILILCPNKELLGKR